MPQSLALSPRRAPFLLVWRELYRYRVLLFTLVARQLQARYRGSLLGFIWTVLNPLVLMAVYAFVFHYYMRFSVPNYALFLFCGLLPWMYFTAALGEGTNSILAGGGLITKSLFPPHILPTVAVLSNLVNYLLGLPILLVFMFVYGVPVPPTIVAFPLVVALQTAFTWGLVLALSALNVHFRDTQHILGNVLLFWFFLCPVIYPPDQIPEQLRFIQYANPIGLMIEAYDGIFLYGRFPSAFALLDLAAFSLVAVVVGNAIFENYRETFAELV